MSVNNFDVLKKLQNDNCRSLKAFPLSNVRGARTINSKKGGLGVVEITVDQETIMKLGSNKLVGLMIVVDTDVFNEAKKEMEQATEDETDKLSHSLKVQRKMINDLQIRADLMKNTLAWVVNQIEGDYCPEEMSPLHSAIIRTVKETLSHTIPEQAGEAK